MINTTARPVKITDPSLSEDHGYREQGYQHTRHARFPASVDGILRKGALVGGCSLRALVIKFISNELSSSYLSMSENLSFIVMSSKTSWPEGR